LQSAAAEQAQDAIVPEVVASRLAGVGHATDGQSVQDRRRRVRVHDRARRLSSALRRPVVAAAGPHAAPIAATITIPAATCTILATTVTARAATVTVPTTTVAAAIVAATAATATDAQTTASAAAAAFRENRRRPSGHTGINAMGRASSTPPPKDAGTAAIRQTGKERFDEGQRQEPVSHVQREDRFTGRRQCSRFWHRWRQRQWRRPGGPLSSRQSAGKIFVSRSVVSSSAHPFQYAPTAEMYTSL